MNTRTKQIQRKNALTAVQCCHLYSLPVDKLTFCGSMIVSASRNTVEPPASTSVIYKDTQT